MKMAVWSALGVFAVAVSAVGLFGLMVRPLLSNTARQFLSKLLIGSGRG